MQIELNGMIPKEYIQEFLQLIRTFDLTHPGCHFDSKTFDDTMTIEEYRKVFDGINPPFPEYREWKKNDA